MELFATMSGPDRRHAIGVARRAIDLLAASGGLPAGDAPSRPFVAAALLHDVGKTEARLGTLGRVAATLAALALRRETIVAWVDHRPHATALASNGAGEHAGARHNDPHRGSNGSGWSIREWQARMGRYLMHDTLGAALLEDAGSDALTVGWAREHHLPESRWSVDGQLGQALKEADGD
jgi:hypothetical protein